MAGPLLVVESTDRCKTLKPKIMEDKSKKILKSIERGGEFLAARSLLRDFIVLAFLTALFFHRAFPGDFIWRDAYHEYYVLRLIIDRAGGFPLWNRHVYCGSPLAGAVYPGLWYPVNLLLFTLSPLPVGLSCKLFIMIHFLAAGAGLSFLARKAGVNGSSALVAGLAYEFSGYLVCQHSSINLLPSFTLVPLAMAFMGKARSGDGLRWAALAGVSAGLTFLGGDPQGFALALGLGALWAIFASSGHPGADIGRRLTWGRLAQAVALMTLFALAIAAIEFIPALSVLAQSGRGGGFDIDVAGCWSFHPLRTIEFLLSRPFGDSLGLDNYWGAFLGEKCFPLPLTMSPYLGVWTCFAAALAWRYREGKGDGVLYFFSALLALALLMAAGRHSPVYRLVFASLPGMHLLRYPEKYLFVAAISSSMLAGLGTKRLLARRNEARSRFASLGPPFLALALTVLFVLALKIFEVELLGPLGNLLARGAPAEVTPEMALADVKRAVVFFGFMMVFCLMIFNAVKGGASRWRGALIMLFLFADLYIANSPLAPVAKNIYKGDSRFASIILGGKGNERGRDGRPETIRMFRDNGIADPGRLTLQEVRLWERDTLKPNIALAYGIEYFGGVNVAHAARFDDLMKRAVGFFDLPAYNVRFAAVSERQPLDLDSNARVIESYRGVKLIEFKRYLPRAYFIGRARSVEEEEELFALMRNFQPERFVILETGPGLEPVKESAPGAEPLLRDAEVISHGANRVVVEVDSPSSGWLVLNDSYSPGWSARVNGASAPIYRANGLARAVPVPSGEVRVEFSYFPPGLALGMAITSLALIATLAWFGLAAIRSGRFWKKPRA